MSPRKTYNLDSFCDTKRIYRGTSLSAEENRGTSLSAEALVTKSSTLSCLLSIMLPCKHCLGLVILRQVFEYSRIRLSMDVLNHSAYVLDPLPGMYTGREGPTASTCRGGMGGYLLVEVHGKGGPGIYMYM